MEVDSLAIEIAMVMAGAILMAAAKAITKVMSDGHVHYDSEVHGMAIGIVMVMAMAIMGLHNCLVSFSGLWAPGPWAFGILVCLHCSFILRSSNVSSQLPVFTSKLYLRFQLNWGAIDELCCRKALD